MQHKKKSPRAPSQETAAASVHVTNLRSAAVPDDLRKHPLVREQFFYTLPMKVWEPLLRDLGKGRFDPEVLEIEIQLAGTSDSIGGCVGFRDGLPLTDELLLPIKGVDHPDPLMDRYLQSQGWDSARIQKFRVQSARRIHLLNEPRRGYLGWLLTNRLFLEEFDALMGACPEITSASKPVPLPFAVPIGEPSVPSHLRPTETPDPSSTALREFYERWRLQSISGPRTIQPIGAQFPVMLPAFSAAQSLNSGALLYIPDIAPLPDRDELRIFLEDSIRGSGSAPGHLAEWITLVRAGEKGKKSIQKYARWFKIQHVLRVLYSRHANALHRCNRKMEEVLIEGLSIKSDTIHRDMIELRQRLQGYSFNK